MDYDKLIEEINSKHQKLGHKIRFKNPDFRMRLLSTTVPPLLCLMLRFPFFRFPYVSAMKSSFLPRKVRNRMGLGVRRATKVWPDLSKAFASGRALIVYCSMTGNTEKVAYAIEEACKKAALNPTVKNVVDVFTEDFYDYDLVCVGTPVMNGLPHKLMMKFMSIRADEYRRRSEVRINMKKIPGKNALVFVTYSGPHVGLSEAIPAGKFIKQELEHFGFEVKGEWYIVGEFHGWEEGSIKGKLGDIRGRPNAEDLSRIEKKMVDLIKTLK